MPDDPKNKSLKSQDTFDSYLRDILDFGPERAKESICSPQPDNLAADRVYSGTKRKSYLGVIIRIVAGCVAVGMILLFALRMANNL